MIRQRRGDPVNTSWSKADLHIHTNYSSDGTASVIDILEYVATNTDLRVIAVTDHDRIDGALEARQIAGSYGIEVIVGEEVSTAEGHMLALFIEEPLLPHRPAAETIAAVHAQGGLCIPAHPYGRRVPSMGQARLHERCVGPDCEWPIDAMETFNAGLWLARNNVQAAAVARQLNMPGCGGSDSHHLPTLGLGYTQFPGTTAADLRTAIKSGQIQACGMQWTLGHNVEFIGRWLVGQTQRVLRPSTP
jgi:predicted metal-dependent phosphoesterase TrpH